MKRAVLVAASLALLAATGQARAFTEELKVMNGAFFDGDLNGLTVTDADSVSWYWDCNGECSAPGHDVTTYAGSVALDSGIRTAGDSYTVDLPKAFDPIRYRCTVHSTLEDGKCDGMCGVLARPSTEPGVVTIESPGDLEVLAGVGLTVPVTFSGTARYGVGIYRVDLRVWGGNAYREFPTSCPACWAQPDGSNYEFTRAVEWSSTIDLGPGYQVVESVAYLWPGTVPVKDRVEFLVI